MKFNSAAQNLLLSPLGNVTGNGLIGIHKNIAYNLCSGNVPTQAELDTAWRTGQTLVGGVLLSNMPNIIIRLGGTRLLYQYLPNVVKMGVTNRLERNILNLGAVEVKTLVAGKASYLLVGLTTDYLSCTGLFLLTIGLEGSGADIIVENVDLNVNDTIKLNNIKLNFNLNYVGA